MEQQPWHLKKELSIGTIVSLIILGTGALAGYLDTKALAQSNHDSIEDLGQIPERIIRLEEQLAQLRVQQSELKKDVSESSAESRAADIMTLEALQQIQVAIARLEEKINRSQQ